MKLKKSDLNVKDYPIFYIRNHDGHIAEHSYLTSSECEYINAINNVMNNLDKNACICDSYESAIDSLRYIDYIRNFNTNTIKSYISHIVRYVIHEYPIWVIRKKYKDGRWIKYIDKSIINYLKFSPINGGLWRLSTWSYENKFNITHNASSLGLTIFFDKANAYAKLNELKGDCNE